MCKLKSGIILKNRVFVPEYDSHTDMLVELGIEDNYLNASKKFVRFEYSPADGDAFSDINNWVLKIDQDIIPDWYNEEEYKPQVVEAVKKWAKTHIYIGFNNFKITAGQNYYIKDCQNVHICGNATVEYISDNATVEYISDNATVNNIFGNATVNNIYDNATVNNIYDNATVKYIYDNATVKYIYGNATVKYIYDNATVNNISDNATVNNISDNATVERAEGYSTIVSSPMIVWENKEKLILAQNATFKDCYTKKIYQSGDWTFVAV